MAFLKQGIFLLLFLFSISSYAVEKKDPYEPFIRQIVSSYMAKHNIPGAAIQLYIHGEPHTYYFGYANKTEKTPISEKTIFELGSITKIITSLLISQEVDFAKMKLTDPIKTYWSELPAVFDHITIQQAATHTAGLPFDAPPTLLSETDLLAFFNNKAPKQGKEWSYSNVGIGLLGYLLEKTSERPYDRIYRTHVSWPLGMLPISTNVPDSLKPFYAQGYDLKGNPAPQVESGIFKGASALKMAASDMQNFLSAAIGLPGTPERIFYPMRMTQSVYVKLPERYQGLAWNIHPLTRRNMNKLVSEAFNFAASPVTGTFERPMFYGDALFDKTGSTKGFKSYIAVIPNKKSGIAILTNKNPQTNEIVTVGRQILFNLAKVDSSDYNKTPIVDEG